jgi:hypothetical protein
LAGPVTLCTGETLTCRRADGFAIVRPVITDVVRPIPGRAIPADLAGQQVPARNFLIYDKVADRATMGHVSMQFSNLCEFGYFSMN